MTPFAAAIAEMPQIEKPVATRSERSSEMPRRRPAQRVPKNVTATTATTTASALEAEREDVGEDEVEAEQDDAELEHGTGRDVRGPGRPPRDMPMIRQRDPECDAEDERRQAPGMRAVGAERDGDPGSCESEAGRPPHHSSGCRNG